MAKEVMKLGPIICSIEAEVSYRKLRNNKEDFTLATEKPRLQSHVSCTVLDNKGMLCESIPSKVSLRTNSMGAEIISMCNGKKSIKHIAYELADKYDLDDDDEFVEQVKTFLNIFKTYKLI